MNQEDILTQKRLTELANTAYQRNIPVFSDFLGLNEQSVFQQILHDMPPITCCLMGGYRLAERKIAAFLPYETDEDSIPICVLKVEPINKKFAEELNHRDFLGALLNLGIERTVIGDILVMDSYAYVICLKRMADYIIDNLGRVKHTTVMASYGAITEDYSPKTVAVTGTVQSVRLDSVLSVATGISRSHVIDYIEGARVYVNGRLITTNSYTLKEGDIISVRHVGRFRYCETTAQSKKGRFFVSIEKFI